MAKQCQVTVDTLRYYEREKLLDPVERTSGGQRRYDAGDVAWVRILRCLRATALPIREIRRFAELVKQGDGGIADRSTLLRNHRTQVVKQITELQEALELIDHKIETYSIHLDAVPIVEVAEVSQPRTLNGQGANSNRA